MAAEGAVRHQMIRSLSKACGTLIEATMNLDMTKTVALVVAFMVTEMGGRKGYSTVFTSPVTFNSFYDSEFMSVER